ncbi:MAG: basic secretory protein-like protein [Ekhidna sp.]
MRQLLFPRVIVLLLLCLSTYLETNGQYFGRNKPRYRSFDFEVLQSPNFEIYHYTDDSTANYLAELSERWYGIHQRSFQDTIKYKNPIIFYNNHADFQQTAAISGAIGVGTGGVTEAFKNRVVMPMMETWTQTDHVLGHELVHAFQYNMLKDADSLTLQNIRNLPLWMVEGLAEYLSIGKIDAHTAMWMRDAVMHDDIPSIKDLNTNPKYFPYRYGQAFWAFIGSYYGDSTVMELYRNTARLGLEAAVDTVLNVNTETLSDMWKSALKTHYEPLMKDSIEHLIGRKLSHDKRTGEMNISPAISPDGRYMVFLSERDLFTIDLFLADVQTGRIIRKLSSNDKNNHIDAISYIESAGTWSPDGSRFAYVVFSKGRNQIVITDIKKGKIVQEITIPEVPAISNPVWHPFENKIAFTGLADGQSDLYVYHLDTEVLTRLTNDPYSDIQPSWSPDGQYLVFATDRLSWQSGSLAPRHFNLALLNTSSLSVNNLDFFPGADNLNPVFRDDQSIWFLSNRDGFRNLYSYDLSNEQVYQHTNYFVGISGITAFSPAISYSVKSRELLYSYYQNSKYTIYAAPLDSLHGVAVDQNEVDFRAATLPPYEPVNPIFVQSYIDSLYVYEPVPDDSLEAVPYKPKFKLDYIGNTTVGVSVSTMGTGLVGGVNTLFSDILGNNQLFAGIALNGEIYDFGAQVAYFNQKRRLGWGAALSHVPYRSGGVGFGTDSLTVNDTTIAVDNYALDILRTFEDQVSLFTFLPFSQTRRVELSSSFARYGFRIDRFNNYYYQGFKVGQNREKLPKPDGYNLWNVSTAFVGDNSYFGVAAPMKGHRFRYEVGRFGGEFNFYTLLADYRKYVFLKPVSLAGRAYYYGRIGPDVDQGRISPVFLGFPTLIRGYNDVILGTSVNDVSGGLAINDLYGNRILVTNFEVRLPFSGPKRLALISSRYFFTELNLFMDIGTVWDPPVFETREGTDFVAGKSGRLVSSTGVSMRINLFGQLIIEPFYAIPWQRDDIDTAGVWGINFTPGW